MMRFLLGAAILLVLAGCGNGAGDDRPGPMESHLLPYFRAEFPGQRIVLMIEGDVNDDGVDDLVVVFEADPNYNQKVTVFSGAYGFGLTQPMPAPFQDVAMRWQDIDNQPPTELVLSGRRGMDFGLGVLRFHYDHWMDLFGGLEDCC